MIKDFGDLPKITCYPGLLNQVFMNILANAIDAIHEQFNSVLASGGDGKTSFQKEDYPLQISPQITIRTRQMDKNWIEIEIADNGSGMSAEVQAQLFNPFFTTKASGKGTGLGLSISQQIIVDKHHGHLHCQSLPGQGTVFKIKLPITL